MIFLASLRGRGAPVPALLRLKAALANMQNGENSGEDFTAINIS